MPDAGIVELRGLRVRGRHGVLPQEHEHDQPFEIDLDIALDVSAAARSDDLAHTVDYGAALAAAEAVVTGPHCALLERLARLIGDAVLAVDERIVSVGVVVRKLEPPVAQHVGTAGVRLTVSR